jgi:hypothetical protein
MLSVADLRGRYARLEELSLGLGKELVLIGKGDDPLLYLERKAYLGRWATPWPASRARVRWPGRCSDWTARRESGFPRTAGHRCYLYQRVLRAPSLGPNAGPLSHEG